MKYRERLVTILVVLTALTWEPAALPAPVGPSGTFKSFRVPSAGSQPRHITLGSDGNMWFTESLLDAGKIGRIDARGNITEFPVPNASSQPSDITSGPDGALWFTGPSGFPDFFIGRLTTDGQFTGFAPPCDPAGGCSIVPSGITSGPDGNIWFTERLNTAIVRLVPSTGVFTFFPTPTADSNPSGITVGPDGALWFAEFNANQIGRAVIAANGTVTITEFGGLTGSPDRITAGPDGALWFTEPFPFDNKIGRISTAGAVTEFQLTSPSTPRDIVTGPDGALWFTEFDGERLSQITTLGVVTEVHLARGGPWGIGRGPDASVWLTLIDGNKVARFTLR